MQRDSGPSKALLAVAVALLAVLVVQLPLVLRSPLGPDPVMYDLQAQVVQNGGVLYRDILEPNLPGAVWLHLAVRSIAGWSPVALRFADLVLFAITAGLAATFVPSRRDDDSTLTRRLLVVLTLFGGYATLSEWCHCQRDVWTLPFVLGAVVLRIRRVNTRSRPAQLPSRIVSAFMEGLLWGAAVWLKPHVALAGVAVVVASLILERRQSQTIAASVSDLSLVILGGLFVGGAGVAWLVGHGAWPHLWTTLTQWNSEYLAAASSRWSWSRLGNMQVRLFPWSLVHLIALPAAVMTIVHVVKHRVASSTSTVVLASLYLGWMLQSLMLQHLFDYVHVPGMVLGGALLASIPVRSAPTMPRLQWLLPAAAGIIVMLSLAARGDQLLVWKDCFRPEQTPAVRSTLARLPLPDWPALEAVAEDLRRRHVRDGELTAYHTHVIHLYPMLSVRPSTRFVFTETHLRLFPSRQAEIEQALGKSSQRYVVSNLLEAGLTRDQLGDPASLSAWRTDCPAEALGRFPFNQPVVFRAGPYLVHEVTGPPRSLETRFFPLARQ